MMKKKSMITLGVLGTTVVAFTIGVTVPIMLRDHTTHYTVSIADANDSRYVVSEMDTTQNKPIIGKLVWDVPNKEAAVVNAVAAYLGRDVVHTIPTLNGTYTSKAYRNGLEKLIYDLMNTDSKGAEYMTLKFPTSVEHKYRAFDDKGGDNKNFMKDAGEDFLFNDYNANGKKDASVVEATTYFFDANGNDTWDNGEKALFDDANSNKTKDAGEEWLFNDTNGNEIKDADEFNLNDFNKDGDDADTFVEEYLFVDKNKNFVKDTDEDWQYESVKVSSVRFPKSMLDDTKANKKTWINTKSTVVTSNPEIHTFNHNFEDLVKTIPLAEVKNYGKTTGLDEGESDRNWKKDAPEIKVLNKAEITAYDHIFGYILDTFGK